jgi:phospholipase C
MFAFAGVTAAVLPGVAAGEGSDRDRHENADRETATPIKHVIVIIGENRTFDNIYGTYVPRKGQSVSNLLSKGIVRADGSPGPISALANQFKIANIDPALYFIDTGKLNSPGKAPYAPFLPTPEAGNAPPLAVTLPQLDKDPAPAAPPFDAKTFSLLQLSTLSPALALNDLHLLTTGATGLENCTTDPTEPPSPCAEPDTRVANFSALPNTSFQITGRTVPYDSYTGDMVHRFFHMWQQADCDRQTRPRRTRVDAATTSTRSSASPAATTRAATRWASTTCRGVTRRSSRSSPMNSP